MKRMKKIAFALVYVLVAVMAVATFIEKSKGTAFVLDYVYGAWWFALLWAALAVAGFAYFFRHRRPWYSVALHCSFGVILAGALLTSLTARHGSVHLRMNEPVSTFEQEVPGGKQVADLPFTLVLKDFKVDYHNGSSSPADYSSVFSLKDAGGAATDGTVSMNKIFSHGGIRLMQASFDSDLQGSYLSVNEDPWGRTVTYFGYGLLFFSLAAMLVARNGAFRRLLRDPRLRKGLTVVAMLVVASSAAMAAPTLSREQADKVGKLLVEYDGRICPIQTGAIDFTKKLYGKSTYKEYSAEQVFFGFLFHNREWRGEPILRVKSAALREAAGLGAYVSINELFAGAGGYALKPYVEKYYKGEHGSLEKAAVDLDDRVMMAMQVTNGSGLKALPVETAGGIEWMGPGDPLPYNLDRGQAIFVSEAFNMLYSLQGDPASFDMLVGKIASYQKKFGGNTLPSETQIKAERIYNNLPFTDILYRTDLVAGLLLMILLIRNLVTGSSYGNKQIRRAAFVLLGLSFLLLTFGIVLRCIIAGRLPMGNGYETMLTMAWCVQLLALVLVRRFPYMMSFGFLLSGFFLLVSSIGQMDPQITPLMPVLSSSPLLSLHVSVIMMAYALLSFTFLCAVVAMSVSFINRFIRPGKETQSQVESLQLVSRVFLYPAVALLALGIFIGAIWANQSWGRYWGWDPKEVWALINLLIYAVPIHTGSLKWVRRPMYYHLYMFLAFFTLLMTYIGVNYFLGGMHSYA